MTARLVAFRGRARVASRVLADAALRIGRDPACDLVLDDARISRLHARIDPGEPPTLVPLGRLAVVLNGAPLAGPAPLHADDRVTIGPFDLLLWRETEDAGVTTVTEEPTEQIRVDRHGRLVRRRPVLVGPEGRRFTVARTLLRIGRGRGNDLVVADPLASEVHCVIELDEGRYFVRDLHSTNGTWIDGRQVIEAELAPGSTLRVGKTRLAFEIETVGPLSIEPSPESECHGMVGRSAAMRRLFALVNRVAATGSTILLTGETGTGKELVARALHAGSPRRQGPFVAVNCGALAKDVVESELFGHEKGAFTGAMARRLGAFESASGGTLFLDEVGELPPGLQPKLLRVLETRAVTRVGASAEVPVDVRLVAATHRDLEAEVREGRFREDLFYRLHVIPIELPPLRERPEDLPVLAARLLEGLPGGAAARLTPAALARLAEHHWPGNVRELRNVLERALLLAGEDPVEAAHLRFARVGPPSGTGVAARPGGARRMDEIEREAILAALETTGWNKRAAARELGIAKSTLHEKLRRFGLARRPA